MVNDENISSDISPQEMAELNFEDAKRFDVVLGVAANDMPAKLEYIKSSFSEIALKLDSLKSDSIPFNMKSYEEQITNDYNKFFDNIVRFSAAYEVQIINIINLFDKHNSSDGKLTVDFDRFSYLPALGSILITVINYFGNGNRFDNIPQLTLGIAGPFRKTDFTSQFRSLTFGSTKLALKGASLAPTYKVTLAAAVVTSLEIANILFVPRDPRETNIKVLKASGSGTKLLLGAAVTEGIATPAGSLTYGIISSALGGSAGANIIGGLAGGAVGFGIVVVGGAVINGVVDPVVDIITGERLIGDTSIPANGGDCCLYSHYVREADENSYGMLSNDRNTSLYGITVSSAYAKEMAKVDPVDTAMGLDLYNEYESATKEREALQNYVTALENIPDDIPRDDQDFIDEVDRITRENKAGLPTGYRSKLVTVLTEELEFDPYEYARNN